MARRAKPADAPPRDNGGDSGVHSGGDSGGDSGANGPEPEEELDRWSSFVEFCARNHSGLKPEVLITRAGQDGRAMGARMGTLLMMPLSDLDDRVAAQFPGSHTLRVFARSNTGSFAAMGELELDYAAPARAVAQTPPGGAGDANAAVMAAALRELAAARQAPAQDPLMAKLVETALTRVFQPPPPPPSAATQIAELAQAMDAVRDIRGASARSSDDAWKIEAVKHIGPAAGNFLQVVAGALLMKMSGDDKPAAAPAQPAQVEP